MVWLRREFTWQIIPTIEGEAVQAVWRVSDEASHARGVGWVERIKYEERGNEQSRI